MPYVKNLLRARWIWHRDQIEQHKKLGQDEDVQPLLHTMSELEYVIDLLSTDETYKNY